MRLKIKHRLMLILGSVACVYAATLFLLNWIERNQIAMEEANEQLERETILDRWIEITGLSHARFVRDYSQWDEMLQFVRNPDPKWAKINIDASLVNFEVHAAWVLTLEGQLLHGTNREGVAAIDRPFGVLTEWLQKARTERTPHFFWLHEGVLYEVRGAPVLPSEDTNAVGPPQGWFFAARAWNADFLGKLPKFIECQARLVAPAEPSAVSEDPTFYRARRNFSDWKGQIVRVLEVDYSIEELAQMARFNRVSAGVFASFGILLFLLLTFGLHRWVLAPLNSIGDSLATKRPEALDPILNSKSEMGDIARMVCESFDQQNMLEREIIVRRAAEAALQKSQAELRKNIQDRARLGRDLHDGVIQTLYATGMSLSGVRSLLLTNPKEAALHMEQTQQALNEAIRDLRDFIHGLEPEGLAQQTFTQAIERLCELMRSIRPFALSIAIDEALVEKVGLVQRAHVLQIVREAVSNALRHGQADRISIAFGRSDLGAVLSIEDDGRGFDMNAGRKPGGFGLENIAERARDLGAALTVRSEPGKGTEIRLQIPNLPPSQ